ncbi:MAG TPA: LPS export ABC transporter periplasmic protein LptC [Candidatus Methylomirabilis sp.]|nr:LPS export ABC transporter periplasmic protein LptC [Candidatus Methylomirabilis sp.]
MWRRLWWMIPIMGLLALALALLRLGSSPAASGAAAPAPGTGEAPDMTLREIHMVETRSGSTLWEVRADRAEVHEREGFTVLSRIVRPVEVTLYSNQGQLTCTANQATLDLRTKDVRLEGGVVGRSDQGSELRTEALKWIAASRRLQTDQAVTVSRGGLLSRGRGLDAETGLERVRIFQNITSQIKPADGQVAPRPAGRTAVR